MRFRIEIKGYEELLNTFTRAERISEQLTSAINNVTALIFTNSQMQVPVDTGRLKASGKIYPAQRDSKGIEARIVYNTYYAFWVEVRRDVSHNSPTKAGFLEDSVRQALPIYKDTLMGVLLEVFGKGRHMDVTYRSLEDLSGK